MKVWEALVQRVRFTGFRRRFGKRFQEALVFGAEPSQVQQGFGAGFGDGVGKVPEKVPEKGSTGFRRRFRRFRR